VTGTDLTRKHKPLQDSASISGFVVFTDADIYLCIIYTLYNADTVMLTTS